MIAFFKHNKIILIVIAIGLILRFVAINQSLWLDEAIGALEARDSTYSEIFSDFIRLDNHPPLYYLSLKTWTSIFGFSEIALRGLSVLFGVLTVIFIFKICSTISRNKSSLPLISSVLLATSAFHIYYSQEARMYSMAAFFAAASIYYFLSILDSKKNREVTSWMLFALSVTIMIFTDYVPVFLLPVFFIYAYTRDMDGAWWRKFIASFIPLFVLGVIWIPVMLDQFTGDTQVIRTLPAWKELAGGATIKQALLVWTKFTLGRISLTNKLQYYLLVIISSIPYVYFLIRGICVKLKDNLPFLWLTIPLVLGFVVSFVIPVFIYFRFIYVIPAMYILISMGIDQIRTEKYRYFAVLMLVAINLVGWLIYVVDPVQQRAQWREAVRFVEDNAVETDAIFFEYTHPLAPHRWYTSGKVNGYGAIDSLSANYESTQKRVGNLVKRYSGIYLFEHLYELTDPDRLVEQTLTELEYKKVNTFDFTGVGNVTYWTRDI